MSILRIASRYAKSLFDLAQQDGKLDETHNDIMYIWEVSKNEEFNDFVKNPIIPTPTKERTFDALFKEKVQATTLRALMVLAEHKRERYLKDVCRSFHLMYNKLNKITSAKLITAEVINEETTNNLLKTFEASGLLEGSVELDKEVDPNIIGGFILEFDDQVYDASIAYQVDQMESEFSENLYIKNL